MQEVLVDRRQLVFQDDVEMPDYVFVAFHAKNLSVANWDPNISGYILVFIGLRPGDGNRIVGQCRIAGVVSE